MTVLDTSNDAFNQKMQHVGSAVGIAPMPQGVMAVYEWQLACVRFGFALMRTNPFLAPFVPGGND
jgi:hypothetical protein